MLLVGQELDDREMRSTASGVLMKSDDLELASIARATEAHYEAAEGGRLDRLRDILLETLRLNQERGHSKYQGISLLNLSSIYWPMGNAQGAVSAGTEAIRILGSTGGRADVSAAHSNVARGLAYLGQWDEARVHMKEAINEQDGVVEPEVICEAAELETMFGDPERGTIILDRAFSEAERRRDDPFCRYVAARIALEHGQSSRARELLRQIGGDPWVPGFRSARLALDLQLRATDAPGDPAVQASCDAAEQFALQQQAWLWWRSSRLTRALVSPSALLVGHLHSLEHVDASCLSIQAGLVLRRLGDLDEDGASMVGAEASRRPERWRWALRRFLSSEGRAHPSTQRAVALLERVGEV
jgi:hypothetical protein